MFPTVCCNARKVPVFIALRSKFSMEAPQFYRRQLPDTCISFCSPEGRKLFTESLLAGYMNSYFGLAAQFRTQDEPAFCGLSTLVMALNTLEVDPKRVWKGPWRWYHEQMLDCCIPMEVIEKRGITLDQFACLASCNTLNVKMVRVETSDKEDEFRQIVKSTSIGEKEVLIASYSRRVLGQTGDGHFSPVAGYHAATDMLLVLDTARFKYPPHWVKLPLLFQAMKAKDKDTGLSRGYVTLTASDTRSLLVFRVSSSLSITLPDAKPITNNVLSVSNSWSSWLQQSAREASVALEHLIGEAVQFLSSELSELHNSTFLTTQIDVKCAEKLSSEHSCAVRELIAALEQTPMYHIIKVILQQEPILQSKICGKIGQPVSTAQNVCSAHQTSNGVFSRCTLTQLNDNHFLAMLLLSWPYANNEDTMGMMIQKAVSLQVSRSAEVLQNEVSQLRQQLDTVMVFMKRCQECHCAATNLTQSAANS